MGAKISIKKKKDTFHHRSIIKRNSNCYRFHRIDREQEFKRTLMVFLLYTFRMVAMTTVSNSTLMSGQMLLYTLREETYVVLLLRLRFNCDCANLDCFLGENIVGSEKLASDINR